MVDGSNVIRLEGKISRVGILSYTPSGIAILPMTIAVPQQYLGKKNIGYFQAIISGSLAEERAGEFKIGRKVSLTGSLWTRTYRNRQSISVSETSIIIDSIGGKDEKK